MAIKVLNVGRLQLKLNQISNIDLKDKVVQATTIVHGQAKALAPVDTGNLTGSIHMKVEQQQNFIAGRVFTNTEYAPFVEFGTGIKGNGTYPYKIKGLKLSYRDTPWVYSPDDGETFYRTKGQVAQPFMYPALNMNKDYIKKLFRDGIKKEISKISKGG